MKASQTLAVLFWLYKSKMKNGKAPIYCRVTVRGKRKEISTRQFIDPSKWVRDAGRVKGSSEEARRINAHLSKMEGQLHNDCILLEAQGKYVTAETLKNSLLGIEDDVQKSLIETFEYHNKQVEELIGVDYVKATLTKFETVLKKLKVFLKKKYNVSDILLEELNHKFAADFEYFLKVDEGIGHNTTMKYIRNLKKVTNMAVANDWLLKNPFMSFKCTYKKVNREILTQAELDIMTEKRFMMPRLEEVRDIFLFCCYTGYAFSDVESLTPDHLVRNINGELWIHTNRIKTGTTSNVPLLSPALAILEKYKEHPYCEIHGKLLPVKSNQKMNAYLKEIADLCGIKKKLTMHIARHTFATTVTLANGVPLETVSKLLGHTKLVTTQIYARVMEHKVSDDMSSLNTKLSANKKREEDLDRGIG